MDDMSAAEEQEDMMMEMAAAAPMAPLGRSRRAPSKQRRDESVVVATSTEERGDQFEYAIDRPVTVRRGQSGLVPILRHDFAGRSVLLYDPTVREANPMAALRLHNDTPMTLEGGPMTVLIDGAYVGEAMLSTLRPRSEPVRALRRRTLMQRFRSSLGLPVSRCTAGGCTAACSCFRAMSCTR